MQNFVSVILPVYNRSSSLVDACASVLSQSHRDLELIIVDDASTEDLKPVVDALEDTRVRYIRLEQNGGASYARNVGLEHAKGSIIAFQDSDDLWLPGKLARQVSLLQELPPDVGVVTGSKILYGRDATHGYGAGRVTCAPPPEGKLELDEDQVRKFLQRNRISLQNALFRKDCFPDPKWFDPCAKANADWEFTVRLVQHTRVFEELTPVVVAFISDDSISTKPRKKALGLARILKKNRHLADKYPDLYAQNTMIFARALMRVGKRRMARKFATAALGQNFRGAFRGTALIATGKRRLKRLVSFPVRTRS